MGKAQQAAGGGKVTVEGLAAAVVQAGKTVTVKQGSKVVQQTTGSLMMSNVLACAAAQALTNSWVYYTVPENDYIGIDPSTKGPSYNGGYAAPSGAIKILKPFKARVVLAGVWGGDISRKLWIAGKYYNFPPFSNTQYDFGVFAFKAGDTVYAYCYNGQWAGAVIFMTP